MAWYRKTEWIASRTGLLPRNEKRHVGHAAGDLGVGQFALDAAGGLDEVHRVVVVLFDAGGDGKDVWVEDDVLGGETDLVDQDAIGALADLELALFGVGLADLVEGHDHRRGAIAPDLLCLLPKRRLAFLHADGVDDGLALHALETGLDHRPFGRVDHDRHAGDVRLGGDQVQEAHHGRLRVEHRLVHVDVDDLGAVLHLLAGDVERGVEVAVQDQALELGGAGDVGALADVDKGSLRGHGDVCA